MYFDLFVQVWLYSFILVFVTLKHCALLCLEMSSIIVGFVFTGGAGAGYSLSLGYGAVSLRVGIKVFYLG